MLPTSAIQRDDYHYPCTVVEDDVFIVMGSSGIHGRRRTGLRVWRDVTSSQVFARHGGGRCLPIYKTAALHTDRR